jgi:hypothetical protein
VPKILRLGLWALHTLRILAGIRISTIGECRFRFAGSWPPLKLHSLQDRSAFQCLSAMRGFCFAVYSSCSSLTNFPATHTRCIWCCQ